MIYQKMLEVMMLMLPKSLPVMVRVLLLVLKYSHIADNIARPGGGASTGSAIYIFTTRAVYMH